MNCIRLSTLVAGLAVAVSCTSTAWAAAAGGGSCLTIPGGGSSSWSICDNITTSNALPVGGTCGGGAVGAGASAQDAQLGMRGDAFDDVLVFINNTQVGGVATQVGNGAVFAAQTIAGLTTQLRWDVLATEATARAYLSLGNATGAPITVTVDYLTNFGSDAGTVIRGSSSGDAVLALGDRWVVSSDASPTTGDPVNTTVLWGGTPPVQPNAISNTVFNCADVNGARATYAVTVPAGATQALLFFQRLSDSDVTALATATNFDNVAAGSPLLAGLSGAQTAAVQNFALGGGGGPVAQVAVPVGGKASVLLAVLLALLGGAMVWRQRHPAL